MTEQFANGYALLIGVNENDVNGWALPDVAKDIEALEKVLIHPERCAYPEDNVKKVTGQEATRLGIQEALEWLQKCVQADSSGNATAIIYYTGHGLRDTSAEPPEFYLIPRDVREGLIRSRALRATDFAEEVGVLQPRRLLVMLDCCHAGGMAVKDVLSLTAGYVRSAIPVELLMTGETAISSAEGAKGLEALQQGSGRAVLSASRGEQQSYIRKDHKMSIFTYHLIEALTGHAQPEEGATNVLVSDVMSYVYRRVPDSAREDWGREQESDYQVRRDIVLQLIEEHPEGQLELPACDGTRTIVIGIDECGNGVPTLQTTDDDATRRRC